MNPLLVLLACTGPPASSPGPGAGAAPVDAFTDDVLEQIGDAPSDTGTGDTPTDDCPGVSTYDGPPTADWLFGEGADLTVNAFSLDLPESSAEVLGALTDGSDDIVCGTLTTPHGVLANVGIRMRGKAGNSFDTLDGKPYLEVQTARFVVGQTLSGLTRFRFYNNWEDQSGLQRYLGYQLWRDAGYPAPRAGFATLTLDGRYLGLYGTNEGIDEALLEQWPAFFPDPDNSSIYEGEYGNDLTGEWVGGLAEAGDLEEGDAEVLYELAAIVESSPDIEADLAARMDAALWHRHWALEMAVGAREGYTYIQNNWYLVLDPDTGLATMLPWGFDQVLWSQGVMPDNPAGLLPRRGNEQTPFFEAQCAALAEVVEAVDWGALRDDLAFLDVLLPPEDAIDEDRFSPVEIRLCRDEVDEFLEHRPRRLLEWHAESCGG